MTQEYVANALGIRATNYAKYESGERTPKDDRIIELAKILNVSYSILIDGEENIAVDLLNNHLRGAVLGDIDGFNAFVSDFAGQVNVYQTIMSHLSGWDKAIQQRYSDFHSDFLEEPNLASLVELDKRYKASGGWFNAHHFQVYGQELDILDAEHEFNDDTLDDETLYKMAFCVAAERYIDLRPHGSFCENSIYTDVREYLGNENMSDMEALQFFSVKVFVPLLAHILDALEFIASNNSNMDDFANVFLFNALTRHEDDDEWADLD